MSESTYNRSYSAAHDATPHPGFASSFKQRQFHTEVANSAITANLHGVSRTGDSIDIVFDADLSGADETVLDGLISNHVPDTTPTNFNYQTFSVKKPDVAGTSYGVLDRVAFRGGTYAKIYSISYMDTSVTDYSIRIYDRTNGNIIVEATGLTNTNEGLTVLGLGSNISATNAVWEIQANKTGGSGNKTAHVDSIYIEYV